MASCVAAEGVGACELMMTRGALRDERLSKSLADVNCDSEPIGSEKFMRRRTFAVEEVGAHRAAEDTWIVVDGNVYCITEFLQNHPGGAEVILEHLQEKDAGQLMRGLSSSSDHAHSDAAFGMLKDFHIGTLRDLSQYSEDSTAMQLPGREAEASKPYVIDLSKPLVFQVGHLGEGYQEWVHQPIVQKESPRFFKSDFMESLTKTLWWVVPIVWIPVVIWCQVIAVRRGLPVEKLVTTMPLGIFIWTLVEYALHRFLFHMKTTTYWSNTLHYLLHGCHHKHPMDGYRLVFPPTFAALFGVILYGIVRQLFTRIWTPSVFGGGLLGYVVYDVTHYFIHHGAPIDDFTRRLKRYHLNHHFKVQNDGFGITSPFWDYVFGTVPSPLKYDQNVLQ